MRRLVSWSIAVVLALGGVVALPALWTDAEASSPIKVGGRELFVGNVDGGDFCQWATVQNKVANKPACSYDQAFHGMRVERESATHKTAARFEVRDGDVPEFGGDERAELRAPGVVDVREGDERWYEVQFRFPSSFQNPTSWFVVLQWHAGGGPPPLALEVSPAGTLDLVNNRGEAPKKTIGPVRKGSWVKYVLHVKFSTDPAVGFAEVYEDGTLVVAKHPRRTMSSASAYLKTGIYRDVRETSTAVLWQDGFRVTAP